jgi:exosortase
LNLKDLDKTTTILALLASVLFITAYFPVFRLLASTWAESEEYNHAFLTLPIIGYMAWNKKSALSLGHPKCSPIGLLLLLFAMPAYFFAMLTEVRTIIALALFLTIVGTLIYLLGIQALKELFVPLLLLLLLIPFPEQLYIKLTFPLQLKVSQASEIIVQMFGAPLLREGNVMNIPEKSFEVVEACSGLRSMITLITLSIIMGYFMLKKNSSKLILLLASVPTAIAINIIRVTAMILLFHFFKLDLTEGTLHSITGLLIFGIALGILLLLNKVLEAWETE